jgi:ribosomal protein L37E
MRVVPMASKSPESDGMTEECARCGRETPHTVSVELRTESAQEENAEFSREPYRVAECTSCGTTTKTRMNNA